MQNFSILPKQLRVVPFKVLNLFKKFALPRKLFSKKLCKHHRRNEVETGENLKDFLITWFPKSLNLNSSCLVCGELKPFDGYPCHKTISQHFLA